MSFCKLLEMILGDITINSKLNTYNMAARIMREEEKALLMAAWQQDVTPTREEELKRAALTACKKED